MAVIFAVTEPGRQLGLPPASQEKLRVVFESAIEGLDRMRRAVVKVCYGTDLLGSTYTMQCRGFTLRSQVFTPLELLRQATSVPAEMMMMEGQIGCIAPGAHADLLVVDGDPLRDISLLAADGRHPKDDRARRGGGEERAVEKLLPPWKGLPTPRGCQSEE